MTEMGNRPPQIFLMAPPKYLTGSPAISPTYIGHGYGQNQCQIDYSTVIVMP